MRSISLSFGALLCVFALLIGAVSAVDRGPIVHRSGNHNNRLIRADASPMQVVSNGIASQLPPQEHIVVPSDDASSATPRLVQKLPSSDFDDVVGSFNVKAVAHVGIAFFLDLAAPTNTLVSYLVGNDTVNLFAKTVPARNDDDDDDAFFDDGSGAASPRRKIALMSIALAMVMIFFTVWM
ncbi:hypothetical protein B0T10DRAFT_462134 [Thelonectria olida]|uniref:Uncharacterized protein n=1 Tax=Thelonectria olida TaxID=1576542 RepID=A0A9P8VZD4_9HYPO|nr:hypothetical protein B0T10DRAFT_462134 [Thelonectria olida]